MPPEESPQFPFLAAPLSRDGSATTLRLRHLMEETQRVEIGQRIRHLRQSSAERLGQRETNRSIADYVGVTERAVTAWQQPENGTAPSYDHAKQVAELFQVSTDWLWRGREKGEAPDLMADLDGSQLDRMEAKLDRLLALSEDRPLSRPEEIAAAAEEPLPEPERIPPAQPATGRVREASGPARGR